MSASKKPKGWSGSYTSKITFIMAIIGMERIMPAAPQISPPMSRATMAAKGLRLTLEPTTKGVIKLPSRNCTNINTATTSAASSNSPVVASVNKAGSEAPIRMPM